MELGGDVGGKYSVFQCLCVGVWVGKGNVARCVGGLMVEDCPLTPTLPILKKKRKGKKARVKVGRCENHIYCLCFFYVCVWGGRAILC